MTDTSPPGRLTEVHVAGWTVVQVAGDLDVAGAAQLVTHVAPELVPGAGVAVDLRAARVDPIAGVDAMRGLLATATRVDARLVTVESNEQERQRLRAAGFPEVYESLDAALHVTTAVLRSAVSAPTALVPASGDALLVATEDATGVDEAPR